MFFPWLPSRQIRFYSNYEKLTNLSVLSSLNFSRSLTLQVISRGIRMTAIERDAIVPLLAVFSSVFGYLLVTINDTEFYDDSSPTNTTNASPAVIPTPVNKAMSKHWMPFTLRELVPMSLALRDVTLGLIELAFPESRPSIREDYQQAVRYAGNNLLCFVSCSLNCKKKTTIFLFILYFKVRPQPWREGHSRFRAQ